VHHLLGLSRVAGVLLTCLLGACSSGSDDSSPTRSTEIDVSTNELLFAAAGPAADAPAAQNITATFGEGVVHLAVINNSTNVADVTSVISGQSAEITVTPVAPSELGSGIFATALAVTGYFCSDADCTSLAAGNTQTVNVRYQISPVIERIAPYVATAGVSDSAVVRGIGFSSFAPQGVRFGDTAATEFTVVNDTELRVTYPALAAGTYEIQIDIPDHEGDLESTASLLVLEPTDYAAQTLTYSGSVSAVNRVIYDAERSALLIATDAAVLRYPSEGGVWGTPTSATVGGLRDISLTMNGSRLLTVASGSVIPTDPVTLAGGTAIAPASALASGVFLKSIAVLNDERAIITTGRNENNSSSLYLYAPTQTTLTQVNQQLNNATPAVSANGTSAIFVQGHSSASNNLPVYLFTTGNGQFEVTAASIHQNTVVPAVDRSGSRAVLNGTQVRGTGFALFGTLPSSTAAVALKSNGTRAYAYDPTAGGIVTYNTSADNDEDPYPAVGTTTPIAGDPGSGVKMTISPDGRTLFLAGSARIVVQPTPTF
jgi:hypothetical protein